MDDLLLSRQRRWQLRKRAEGRCTICGRPRDGGTRQHCRIHAEMHNGYNRDGRFRKRVT